MATSQGGSALFYVSLVASLAALACLPAPPDGSLGGYKTLAACLAVTLVAVLASQAAHHFASGSGSEFERAGRLVLGMLVCLAALRRLDPRDLRYPLLGFALAGWVASVTVAKLAWATGGRPETEEYNAVGYGNLLLLFGVLVVFSLGWRLTRHSRTEAAVKIVTAVAAFYGFVLTQTRTGWMAVPVFILIGVALFAHKAGRRKAIAACFIALALAAAVGASSSALRQRVELGVTELHKCEIAPLTDSSMCIRLQLWGAAWRMFTEQPLFGIGGGKPFVARLQAEEGRGVSTYVAQNFGEAHSDPLYTLATTGILGGIGLLLAYFAPAWIFLKRLIRNGIPQEYRVAAAMGLAFCLGFAIFGLTELMFRGMRTVSFYAVSVAWLLAASHSATVHYGQPHGRST
ncbi:O-antigen ligase family protein [Achromobacter aloeverae]|uniref:O-antigen polymerase n=1 Tax=Achromobacter aloeverae TaxID=1750518 RepID=A0A4Q1HIG4_9BURK|nr:O-antigen ligase family protein [Achromobacter aloeverae]RXN86771.1 O-antigen polymerase [Achromobacter aloeverae]